MDPNDFLTWAKTLFPERFLFDKRTVTSKHQIGARLLYGVKFVWYKAPHLKKRHKQQAREEHYEFGILRDVELPAPIKNVEDLSNLNFDMSEIYGYVSMIRSETRYSPPDVPRHDQERHSETIKAFVNVDLGEERVINSSLYPGDWGGFSKLKEGSSMVGGLEYLFKNWFVNPPK